MGGVRFSTPSKSYGADYNKNEGKLQHQPVVLHLSFLFTTFRERPPEHLHTAGSAHAARERAKALPWEDTTAAVEEHVGPVLVQFSRKRLCCQRPKADRANHPAKRQQSKATFEEPFNKQLASSSLWSTPRRHVLYTALGVRYHSVRFAPALPKFVCLTGAVAGTTSELCTFEA